MTRDKKLVLLHDDSLARTTTGKGLLAAHTLADIQAYALKDAQGYILEGQHIPVFRDVLAMIAPQTLLMLDMKPGTSLKKMMAEVIVAGRERQVIVICYTLKKARELHRKYPYLMLALGFNSEAQIMQIKKADIAYNRWLWCRHRYKVQSFIKPYRRWAFLFLSAHKGTWILCRMRF